MRRLENIRETERRIGAERNSSSTLRDRFAPVPRIISSEDRESTASSPGLYVCVTDEKPGFFTLSIGNNQECGKSSVPSKSPPTRLSLLNSDYVCT